MPLFEVRYFSGEEQIGDTVIIDRELRADAIDRAIRFAKELPRRGDRAVIRCDGKVIEEVGLE